MSKEKLHFRKPANSAENPADDGPEIATDAAETESTGKSDKDRGLPLHPALRRLASRRWWPVYAAGLTTILWLGGFAIAAWREGILATPGLLSLPELSALVGGIAAPVAVIWLIALVYQRTDPLLERRIEMVQGMDKALAPIEVAEKRLGQIGIEFDKQVAHIELAVDVASQRIEHLEGRFQGQISELFSATADADAKSASMRDGLERQRQSMDDLSQDIEKKATGIEETITKVSGDLEVLIESARSESETAAALLTQHSDSLKSATNNSVQSLDEVGETIEKHRVRLKASVDDSRTEVADSFADVMTRADALSERMGELEANAQSLTEELAGKVADIGALTARTSSHARTYAEALSDQNTAMANTATEAAASAQRTSTLLASQALQVEDVAGGIENRIEETITTALGRITDLETKVSGGAEALEASAEMGVQNIERVSTAFNDHSEIITRVASDAAEAVRSAQEALDNRTEGLGQMLLEAKQRLEDAEETIARQQAALTTAAQQSAGIMEDTSVRLQTRTEDLAKLADDTARNVNKGSEALAARMVQLRETGNEVDEDLARASEALHTEGDKTIEKVRMTTDVLNIAAYAFSEERSKFEVDMGNIVNRLESGVQTLHGESTRLTSEGEAAATRLSDLSGDLARTAEATRASVESAAENLKEHTETELAGINAQFGGALDGALSDLRQATDTVAGHAGEAAERVAGQADRIVSRAELFVSRADELQRKLSDSLQDDFLKSSSLLVESLSAGAFDIGRVLETDIPDTVWKKYLAGDRNIFARRAVKLGNRAMRKEVAEKFAKDAEFRDHVLKFMRDFESLMERVMATTGGNAISVTLISSELGKLYVFLAQAMKKM